MHKACLIIIHDLGTFRLADHCSTTELILLLMLQFILNALVYKAVSCLIHIHKAMVLAPIPLIHIYSYMISYFILYLNIIRTVTGLPMVQGDKIIGI